MTISTVSHLTDTDHLTKILVKVISVLMMSTVIGLACYGLVWSVKHKFNSIEPSTANEITAKVRERQLACLARNIYYEAGSEPFEGKVAVAQVTLNRMESGKFPDDVCRVIYQKNGFLCQFSWYCDREAMLRPIHEKTYLESMEVAKKVLLEGFRLPSLKNALYFHGDYINPGWNKERVAKIGRHIFYN
jgi:spore germination cell wall hydrolase CwlJ-like protein